MAATSRLLPPPRFRFGAIDLYDGNGDGDDSSVAAGGAQYLPPKRTFVFSWPTRFWIEIELSREVHAGSGFRAWRRDVLRPDRTAGEAWAPPAPKANSNVPGGPFGRR
ncbi:hypothetical protein Zm00014a_013724 [Zea mays]|uniref:Uncharacterized protein n=1 Tax=Zea mays TaxID=4577 RepID=A0A3L6EBM7_MAIZE|nr:hypothetical protein Zm00014a_013724 [Zea mays]